MAPIISFVIPCKGRLDHLKETLPNLVDQESSEVVIVDYDCPDGTKEWVNHNYPRFIVEKVENRPEFNLSKARNIGLHRATGDWVFFLDADIFLSKDFVSGIKNTLSTNHYYLLGKERHIGSKGSVLVQREMALAIKGYDENYLGYSWEDIDFFTRLTYGGLSSQLLTEEPIGIITHSDDARVEHYDINRMQSISTNRLYTAVKRDLMRFYNNINLSNDVLVSLRNNCEQSVLNAMEKGEVTASLVTTLPEEKDVTTNRLPEYSLFRRRLHVEVQLWEPPVPRPDLD
ncbi:glycosyltransferase family 2 protein [Solemya velum gill symbiont]|uniref:glycosyltransferase family 2 protein n=1 Tax=Solemya velum gill symbiont TaxID=2340 RepID=UPI000996951C|nr:glycosyltransferase family A protein [Solemya velum gill symbiont]OOZ56523.1 hypothetical protein BOW42_07535 [Solemya velum gill symbiont]